MTTETTLHGTGGVSLFVFWRPYRSEGTWERQNFRLLTRNAARSGSGVPKLVSAGPPRGPRKSRQGVCSKIFYYFVSSFCILQLGKQSQYTWADEVSRQIKCVHFYVIFRVRLGRWVKKFGNPWSRWCLATPPGCPYMTSTTVISFLLDFIIHLHPRSSKMLFQW